MTSSAPIKAAGRVVWPQRYDPAVSPVHVSNTVLIPAEPEVVWAWLIRATFWPSWYANSHDLEIIGPDRRADLAAGTRFRWKTFGVRITSEVIEFDPLQRIAWNARGFGVDAYHAWVITPTEGGCRVLTEECQHGWGARLVHFLMPKRMWHGHELWLSSLRTQSVRGLPPPA